MSREQEQPLTPAFSPAGERETKPHQRLPGLLDVAVQERNPEDKRRFTTEVIDALIAMRAPGDEAEEAQLILAQLEANTLAGLVDEHGRTAHREAVETLLSLGFPHALKVSPADLQRYREAEVETLGGLALETDEARSRAMWIALAAQGAGMAYSMAGDQRGLFWAALSAVAGVSGAVWLKALAANQSEGVPVFLLIASACLAGVGMISSPALLVLAVAMGFATAAAAGTTLKEE